MGVLRCLLCIACALAVAGCLGKPARVSQMTATVSASGNAAAILEAKTIALGMVTGGEAPDASGFYHKSAITEASLRAAVESSLRGSGLLWSGSDTPPRSLSVAFLKLTRMQYNGAGVEVTATIGYTVTADDGSPLFQKIVEFSAQKDWLDDLYGPNIQQAASEEAVRGNIRQFLEAWLAAPTGP